VLYPSCTSPKPGVAGFGDVHLGCTPASAESARVPLSASITIQQTIPAAEHMFCVVKLHSVFVG